MSKSSMDKYRLRIIRQDIEKIIDELKDSDGYNPKRHSTVINLEAAIINIGNDIENFKEFLNV